MTPATAPSVFETIRLPRGVVAVVRPVTAADDGAERDFFAGLSDRSRFNRFHGVVNGLSDAMARYLAGADQCLHVALVATVVEGGRETVIADARYVACGDCAEFAIAVSDRFQGCGIAARLLDALATCARRAGLRWLVGEVLASNQAMLRFAERMGFARSSRACDDGIVRVERALAAPAQGRATRCSRLVRLVRSWLAPRCAPQNMFVPF